MISIEKYDSQSEKNSKLLSQKNNIVSEEGSAKNLIDVKDEEDEDIYIHISDHSNTVNYNKLNEHKKDTGQTITDTPSVKDLMKKDAKSKNYAQVSQNLQNAPSEEDYIPSTLQPKGEYNTSMSKPSEMYSVGSNNEMLSDSSPKPFVSSTSLVGNINNAVKKTDKTHKSKRKTHKANKTREVHNKSYTLIESHSPASADDKSIVFDNASVTSNISADISKGKTEKMLSKSALSVNFTGKVPNVSFNKRYYNGLVKRRHFEDLLNNLKDINTENRQYTLSDDTVSTQQIYQRGQHSIYRSANNATGSALSVQTKTYYGSPSIKKAGFSYKKAIANIAVAEQRLRLSKNKPTAAPEALSKPLTFKKQIANNMVNIAGETAHKVLKSSGNTLYSVSHSAFESAAENTAEAQGINALYTVVETGKNIRAGHNVIVSTTKGTVHTVKGAVHLAKTVPGKVKSTVHFYNRIKRMNFQRIRKFGKMKFHSAVKKIKNEVAKKVKAVAAAVLALFAFLAVFLIFIGCLIGGIFASVIFQAESVLDTTQLVKYISKLDKDMQNDWYKGKTAAEIAKQNDSSSDISYEYHYYIAKDKPADTYDVTKDYTDSDFNCLIKVKYNPEKGSETVGQKGYTQVAHSKDEFLEEFRWTTDDYIAALAYLQIQNENLGWFSSTFGWVGETKLKAKAEELHRLTYGNQMYAYENTSTGDVSYTLTAGAVYSTDTMAGNTRKYCYFGRKYSIKYLVENDLLPTPLTEDEKERFENICKYGNSELAVLSYPLDGDIDIAKHFGEQLYLKFNPASDDESYPSVSKATGKHYAVDLNATTGDIIKSPLSGYCRVAQQDRRGFEFVISTNPDFETGEYGYICKISCASTSFIPTNTVVKINAGDSLGRVAAIQPINYATPTNDTDVFADSLYPCGTNTDYHSCDGQGCTEAEYTGEYVHLELYKLPCDFTSSSDMEKNVLAPELFFIYPDN